MSRRSKSVVQIFLNLKVIVGVIFFCFLFFTVTVSLVWLTKPDAKQRNPAPANFIVIPAPTSTNLTLSITPETIATLSTNQTPQIPPGVINVGLNVQISGTGGDGLRLRSEPGLEGQVLILGNETEVFKVVNGPTEVDGFTWWYLVGLYDETRYGWSVSDYLEVVNNP